MKPQCGISRWYHDILPVSYTHLDVYKRQGADCVSCLTEPKWFLGSDAIFEEVRKNIQLPMIRKDFTVDDYQIYQAKCMGADAVLLLSLIHI